MSCYFKAKTFKYIIFFLIKAFCPLPKKDITTLMENKRNDLDLFLGVYHIISAQNRIALVS